MNNEVKILLWPLSVIYGFITFLRNCFYNRRLLKEKKFDIHTIGVGNLAVGGAGKTPLVEYLVRLLLSEGFKIATLSRGYKRKTKGFVLATENSTAHDIGDEPLIYKSKYNIKVAVDANRVRGVERLANFKDAPSVILLDDVFQHRAVRCGMNILVTDYYNLFFKDSMLPSGTLREYKSGMARADIIVVSKAPESINAVEMRQITKDINPHAHQRVFFSYLKYGELYSISNSKNVIDTLNDLFKYQVICFAGIANAGPMISYLKEYASEVKHLPFPDHYEYKPKDLIDIEKYYHSLLGNNKLLVTTEKDLMRLRGEELWPLAQNLNIYILPVEVIFKHKKAEFDKLILKYVTTNRIYHEKYSRKEP